MKEVPLTKGYMALVDDEDYERVLARGKWHAFVPKSKHTVYAIRTHRQPDGKRQTEYLHRFILNVTDPKVEVDHQNHNGLDCQQSNLRAASKAQNMGNQLLRRNPKSSRYKGVRFNKKLGKWEAYIGVGKYIYLGLFTSEAEAAAAYDAKARELFKEFAAPNFEDWLDEMEAGL